MSRALILAAIGGAIAYAATRKPKPKRTAKPALPNEELESGIGYSETLGINVSWSVSRIDGRYVWAWQAHDPELAVAAGVPLSDSNDGFASEEDATEELWRVLKLQALPKPPPDPEKEEEEGPKPPALDVEVFPTTGDKSKLPDLYDPEGMVVSADCNVAGVGMLFWDGVGDRVEEIVGEGTKNENAILQILAEEFFPMEEIHLCPGASKVYDEMTKRVRSYLES